MICKKCGNEIKDGEKFCGKCGTQVEISQQDKIVSDNKEPIKIKFKYFLVGIVAVSVLFLILMIIVFIKNSSTSILSSDENTANKNYQNNYLNGTQVSSNKILDVIDQENQEFKINAKELVDAIVKANDEINIQERNASKFPLTYNVEKQIDQSTGKEVICYILKYENLPSYPFMLIANADTNNVYRISVCHPFLNDYGTELNSGAIEKNYTILEKALKQLNQDELYNTIVDIRNTISKSSNGLSSDWNIKGVFVGATNGTTNKNGNLSSIYYFYGTK